LCDTHDDQQQRRAALRWLLLRPGKSERVASLRWNDSSSPIPIALGSTLALSIFVRIDSAAHSHRGVSHSVEHSTLA